ncbi:hypothetical protein [Herminiimonas aquatilis]|uniref:Uncharacterized protein n=1 Tax=Herminiimonas aquatilis TaxID=345342 RepID=A0ABW2J186_9BURK
MTAASGAVPADGGCAQANRDRLKTSTLAQLIIGDKIRVENKEAAPVVGHDVEECFSENFIYKRP